MRLRPRAPVLLAFLAGFAIFATTDIAVAQGASAQAEALRDSIAANQARLRTYQWIQTAQLAVDGELKQTSVNSCRFNGTDPKAVCTEISSTAAQAPSGGPFRKKKMEEAIAGMKAYMDSVKTLLAMYIPPQKAKISVAMQIGGVAVAPNPSTGAVSLVIRNYAQPGDNMTITVGAKSYEMRSMSIATYVGKPNQPVTLTVTFANLNNGVDYAAKTELTAQGDKKIQVQITATNYSVAP